MDSANAAAKLDMVPSFLRQGIERSNTAYAVEQSAAADLAQQDAHVLHQKRKAKLELFKQLTHDGTGGQWEWISVEWLQQWLKHDFDRKTPTVEGAEDNEVQITAVVEGGDAGAVGLPLPLCVHGRIDPRRLGVVKRVTREGVDLLAAAAAGNLAPPLPEGGRLGGDETLCFECVQAVFTRYKHDSLFDETHSAYSARVKVDGRKLTEGMYVNSAAFNDWKRKAYHPSPEQPFNYQSRCDCGAGRIVSEERLRIISEQAWNQMERLFGSHNCYAVPTSTGPCPHCTASEAAVAVKREALKEVATRERTELKTLFRMNAKRPTLDTLLSGQLEEPGGDPLLLQRDDGHPPASRPGRLFLLGGSFLSAWRSFTRWTRDFHDRPDSSLVAGLLCPAHGGLLYRLPEDGTTMSTKKGTPKPTEAFEIVSETEWRLLRKLYPAEGDGPHEVLVTPTGDGGLVTSPPCCEQCRGEQRCESEPSQTRLP